MASEDLIDCSGKSVSELVRLADARAAYSVDRKTSFFHFVVSSTNADQFLYHWHTVSRMNL